MSDKKKLVSLSGEPIWKHKERTKPFELAIGDEKTLEEISEHIEKHVGPIQMVWHEIISDLVHIDLHYISPSENRDFHVFVTSGMSDKPMNTPEGAENCKYAELLVSLPSYWPVAEESIKDEENYWPLRMVKRLARMPHEYDMGPFLFEKVADSHFYNFVTPFWFFAFITGVILTIFEINGLLPKSNFTY